MTRLPHGRRAVLVAAVFLGFSAVHVALAWDGGGLVLDLVPKVGRWLGPLDWAIYAVVAVVLVLLLGRWRTTGITRLPGPGWLRLAAVPVLASGPFLLFGINLAAEDVVPLLVVGVPLIALNEELFFRGLILDLLRPFGWRTAVLGSALLFGASHAVNVVAGASIPFTVLQVAATTAGGITLAAIRIRSGSLWPVLGVHAAIDLVAISTLTGAATGSPWLVPILFLWLATNLALWTFGWRLLAGLSATELDGLIDGRRLGPGVGPPSLGRSASTTG